jgi:Mg2+ and Co2+ transporter CorA
MIKLFLTRIQRKILEMQRDTHASRKIIKGQSEFILGREISISQMHSTNTIVYKDILEALQTLDDYYDLFERRAKRDHEIIKSLTLSINRKINKSIKRKR